MISVQGHAYAKDDPTVEGAELLEVVDEKIESYAKRARSAPVALAPYGRAPLLWYHRL
jgi:hypothetical protein